MTVRPSPAEELFALVCASGFPPIDIPFKPYIRLADCPPQVTPAPDEVWLEILSDPPARSPEGRLLPPVKFPVRFEVDVGTPDQLADRFRQQISRAAEQLTGGWPGATEADQGERWAQQRAMQAELRPFSAGTAITLSMIHENHPVARNWDAEVAEQPRLNRHLMCFDSEADFSSGLQIVLRSGSHWFHRAQPGDRLWLAVNDPRGVSIPEMVREARLLQVTLFNGSPACIPEVWLPYIGEFPCSSSNELEQLMLQKRCKDKEISRFAALMIMVEPDPVIPTADSEELLSSLRLIDAGD